MNFKSLELIDPLLQAVKAEGYETPTPIQVQAIPLILAKKDVLACAQTGTGKTAAFALPILQLLAEQQKGPHHASRDIQVLILTPTRELASQIAQNFSDYGRNLPFKNAVIFGGVRQHAQVRALRSGVEIVIATPGRLLDLMNQRLVHFRGLQILVLDEADRMLDMGFIHDVRKIIASVPKVRQTLFFSATMPAEIRKLSEQILSRPTRIEVTPVASTVDKINQSVYHVSKKQKTALLIRLLQDLSVKRAIVFTRTKRDANRVSDLLNQAKIRAEAIHGNKSQGAREAALEKIKLGHCQVLVATDIAARGIDIDNVTHVFNHDIPNMPEAYVHRIGRTARAGTEGVAISLCSTDERGFLHDIEKLIRKNIHSAPMPDGVVAESHLLQAPAPKRSHAGPGRSRNGPVLRVSDAPHAQAVHGAVARIAARGAAPHAGPRVVIRGAPAKPEHSNPPASPNNRKKRRKANQPKKG